MDRYPISPQFLQKYLTGEYTVPEKEEVEKWYSSLSGTPDQIRVLPASSRAASSRTIGRRWWDSPASANFLVWWDGDLTRELLDGNHIDKYRPNGPAVRLLTAEGCSSNTVPNRPPPLVLTFSATGGRKWYCAPKTIKVYAFTRPRFLLTTACIRSCRTRNTD